MSRTRRHVARILGIAAAVAACVAANARDERAAESADGRPPADVALYMPALEADGPLGFRAATVLNLQIWRTLRKAPTPNRAGLSFGSGVVVWDPEPLDALTHEAAAREARAVDADLALCSSLIRTRAVEVRRLARENGDGIYGFRILVDPRITSM